MLSADNRKTPTHEKGFTLIELSIVLVIIGLIVGGVLVGQDLIRGAEIRATIAQLEKYNTAVNTFRNKYNGIPGDLQEGSAVSFGLYAMSTAGTVGGTGFGDGNGLIEGGAAAATTLNGEVVAFFRHLSDGGFVDGSFAATGAASGTLTTAGALGATTTGTGIPLLLPQAKLARGNYLIPESLNGINYFVITGMNGASITTAGVVTLETNNLTPSESYNMDKKVDDGITSSGAVQAIDGTAQVSTSVSTAATAAAAGSAGCAITGTLTSYNVTYTGQACSLRLKFN